MKMEHLIALAGLDEKKVAETLKESRTLQERSFAEEIVYVYGPLGKAVVDVALQYVEMVEMDGENAIGEGGLTVEGYADVVRDQVNQLVEDLVSNNEFRKFAEQQIGKLRQKLAEPDQGTLNV